MNSPVQDERLSFHGGKDRSIHIWRPV